VLNNWRVVDYLDLIYLNDVELKDIYAVYPDLHLEIDNGGQLKKANIYDKRAACCK